MVTSRFSTIAASIPATVPFTGPETLERRSGRALRLRIGANESPFGASPIALEAMSRAAASGNLYCDPEGYALRFEIAGMHGVPIENVLLGAGIDDLLLLLCRMYLDPGDLVVTSQGGYPTFNYAIAGVGGQPYVTPYVDDRNDLDGLSWLAQRVDPKLVYLSNPDNPSGSWYDSAQISAFKASLPEGSVLVLDEAYADFVSDMPSFSRDDPTVIRLRTFSKAHGMAGLRVGYAVAHSDVVRTADKIRLHFGVNRVAQAGALASLGDTAHIENVVRQTEEARERLAEIARAAGLRPLPSWTNFVAMDCGSRARADAILAALLDRDIFIRKPGMSPLDRCIRVTVARSSELDIFAGTLSSVVAGI